MQPPASNTNTYQPKRHPYLRQLFLFALLVLLAFAAFNRQDIYDWWQLRNYQPPAKVAQIAEQDTMTDYGRKIFYVNRPAIEEKSSFAKSCPNNGGEQTIILGCYRGNQQGIYLLKVDDPRLDGVEQVTAAHEMLHGAYDRLSADERKKVDAMLTDYYNNDLSDSRIRSTVEAYKKTEPNDLVNEMHSIFGTEIANLPPQLEQYYKKYFTNRAQIAAYGSRYQSEFTSRQALVDRYDERLESLKQQIEDLKADLDAKQSIIESQQEALNNLRSSGDVSGYNAGVPAYNAQIDAYNAEVAQIRSLISEYNELVTQRNEVALEQNNLAKQLSGQPSTISQ